MRTLLIAAWLLIPFLATAAELPYSGNLLESGTPVTGNRYVALSVYATPTGGAPLQPAQAESLAVVGGVYHTVLTVPDGVWFGGERWIGASINSSPELSPRMKYYAPPRPRSQLIPRPAANRLVTSTTWVSIDTLVIESVDGGHAVLTHTGSASWQGSGALNVVFPVVMAIGPTTPVTHDAYIWPAHLYTTGPMNFTVFEPVSPGTNVLYLWARVSDQPYAIATQRFQALYIPN